MEERIILTSFFSAEMIDKRRKKREIERHEVQFSDSRHFNSNAIHTNCTDIQTDARR